MAAASAASSLPSAVLLAMAGLFAVVALRRFRFDQLKTGFA